MQVLIKRYKGIGESSVQLNGPDLEIPITRGREISEIELEKLARQFLRKVGIDADYLNFIEYDEAFGVFTTTYKEAKSLEWQEPTRVKLRELSSSIKCEPVDVGNRLVPNYWLSPSGDKLLFTSVLKSGRAISNLYIAELKSGKVTPLTKGASVRSADISEDERTVAYIDDFFGRKIVVCYDGLSPYSMDGEYLGMSFCSLIIGKDVVFCEAEPAGYPVYTSNSLIEQPAFLAYAPKERKLNYLGLTSKLIKSAVARGADVYVKIEHDDTLSVYDIAGHRHRLLHCKHLLGSISEIKIGKDGYIVLLCTDDEGYATAFHWYGYDSGEHFVGVLPSKCYIHEWVISGSNSSIIFSRKETPKESLSGRTIEVINREDNTLYVIKQGGYYRFPQISDNGNRVAWLEISSNKATYGKIYTGVVQRTVR